MPRDSDEMEDKDIEDWFNKDTVDMIEHWFHKAMNEQEFSLLNSHAGLMCEYFRALLRPMFERMLLESKTIDEEKTEHPQRKRISKLRVQARYCGSVLSTLRRVKASQKLRKTLDAVWKSYERDGNPLNLQSFRYLVTKVERHLQLVENTERIFMGLLEDTEKDFECNLRRIFSSQLEAITNSRNIS